MDTIKRVAAYQLLLISILSVLLFLDGMRTVMCVRMCVRILHLPLRGAR